MAPSILLLFAVGAAAGDVAVCPGESDRYGDHKCNHDATHRVCAQLLDKTGKPEQWGKGDFWEITGQESFKWDDEIRANNGDSWCICMWATAHLITSAGCNNVHLHCDSTDVDYVMNQYADGGVDLRPARECLQAKCGHQAPAVQRLSDASLPAIAEVDASVERRGARPMMAMAVAGVCSLLVGLMVLRAVRLWFSGRSPEATASLKDVELSAQVTYEKDHFRMCDA